MFLTAQKGNSDTVNPGMSAAAEPIGKNILDDGQDLAMFLSLLGANKTHEKWMELRWSLFSIIPLSRNDSYFPEIPFRSLCTTQRNEPHN